MEKRGVEKFIFDLLRLMLEKKASDMFITAGFPAAFKVDGKVSPMSEQKLTGLQAKEICRAIMNDKQAAEFDRTNECNFAIGIPDIARFRVSAFVQRGLVGLVFRVINSKIPKLEELGLPEVLKEVAMTERGLVVFVGGTGTGKSASLAAMVGYRNEHSYGHIITIEDPIEFIHTHTNCVVTQREVGLDTDSWKIALKNILRQAPDVIVIGEIRDRDTMEYAIAFAQTGRLCMASLHANSTNQALDRIINFFPGERRQQLLMELSLNLRAFVSQRLLPKSDGVGRMAAIEIMINSPLISDLILKGEVHEIKSVIERSREMGMQTFDQALFDLHEAGKVTYEDALRNADSVNDLRLRFKLESKLPKARSASSKLDSMDMI